ncbi:MAG: DUF4476 domain-containing protein, partial [Flavobacteriales bacterium]|nr:DUF4476 domain-containing protein [Flavobacteriales bacterium]
TRTIENQELTRPTTEVIEIGGCEGPVDEMSFAQMKKSIAGKTFEDSKFTLAKQIAQSNCLWAEQVKEIMMLFDFEDTKLEFAKLAYDSTVDQGSYYIVNDAFEFELTIDELNEYLEMR